MKVEFKLDCAVGAARYKSGTVAVVDDASAEKLINGGQAVPVAEEPKIEDRSIGLDDVKPRTRAKK